MQQFTCIECGCQWERATVRGRVPKLCPTCREVARRLTRTYSRTCKGCGKAGVRVDGDYCGQACATATRWADYYPKSGPACRVFISDCSVCGAVFACRYTRKTCSDVCSTERRRDIERNKEHRRRLLVRDAYVAPVVRLEIHRRDGWRCHICRKLVSKTAAVPNPRAATLDHVVPLASGGTHEPANVRTACFLCNSTKGDRGGNEQLMLVG